MACDNHAACGGCCEQHNLMQAADAVGCFGVSCRGVATISGISVFRQDTPAAGSQQQQEAKSADPQQQEFAIWPQCDPCEDPLLQHALQLAEPLSRLTLQMSVLPSNKPAELLMTFQGEVRGRGWVLCMWPAAASVFHTATTWAQWLCTAPAFILSVDARCAAGCAARCAACCVCGCRNCRAAGRRALMVRTSWCGSCWVSLRASASRASQCAVWTRSAGLQLLE